MTLDIYAENMIRHYESPHNTGRIASPDASAHEENPTCGDEITVYMLVKGIKIEDVKFEGAGCAISMGSASMLTDYIKGRNTEELKRMDKDGLFSIIGITPGPARLHCATLSLKALKKALFLMEKIPVDEITKNL